MKKLFTLLVLLLPFLCYAQVPEEGDYLMTTWPDRDGANYVFLKSTNIYYGYIAASNETENNLKTTSDNIQRLSTLADSIDFSSIKGLDEKNLPVQKNAVYRIIEYRKGDKVNRICWNENIDDNKYSKLNQLVSMLNELW